jgi:hypothetical protein
MKIEWSHSMRKLLLLGQMVRTRRKRDPVGTKRFGIIRFAINPRALSLALLLSLFLCSSLYPFPTNTVEWGIDRGQKIVSFT